LFSVESNAAADTFGFASLDFHLCGFSPNPRGRSGKQLLLTSCRTMALAFATGMYGRALPSSAFSIDIDIVSSSRPSTWVAAESTSGFQRVA